MACLSLGTVASKQCFIEDALKRPMEFLDLLTCSLTFFSLRSASMLDEKCHFAQKVSSGLRSVSHNLQLVSPSTIFLKMKE